MKRTEPRIVLQHPARDRVLDEEEIADGVELAEPAARFADILPALVGVDDHPHAGRFRPDLAAPADDIVLEARLQLDAVIALASELPRERAHLAGLAEARPGADLDPIAHRAAEQLVERHAEGLGGGVPDRTLEAVVFARQRDRQVLQHEVVERATEQAVDDAFDRHPVVVAVEFSPSDRAVGELHLQDELRAAHRTGPTSPPSRRPAAYGAACHGRAC